MAAAPIGGSRPGDANCGELAELMAFLPLVIIPSVLSAQMFAQAAQSARGAGKLGRRRGRVAARRQAAVTIDGSLLGFPSTVLMFHWQSGFLRSACSVVALILCAALPFGAAAAEDGAEDSFAAHCRTGRGPGFDFISDCIVAGGASDRCESAHVFGQYEELRNRVAPTALRNLPARERLTELHALLHAQILIGDYRQDASDLRQTFSSGDYNCLSAAAIYWQLAREAGIELEIWSLPGHVFVRSPAPDLLIIEPAGATWPAGETKPPPAASGARQLAPLELVGRFYYNRGVLALERGEHSLGVGLLRQSLSLDPQDAEAQTNLLAGLNNWAVEQCRQERYAAANALIRQGLAIDRDFAPLLANQRFIRAKLASP